MPDIGLFELLVIGILLFVVVGPERMPEFFSQVDRWMRTGRVWMRDFRSEITRETADITTPIQAARAHVEQQIDDVGRTAREFGSASDSARHAEDAVPADEPEQSGQNHIQSKAD